MIPIFPQFKNLELKDQKEVQSYASKFDPYSDFHFENMWSWDVNESIKISNLNDNLVLLAKDIYTQNIVCSYLGNNSLPETLNSLFDFLDSVGISKPKISLVPEGSLKGLDFKKYFIEIDLNACDYIYNLKELSGYAGNRFMQKRGRSNTFVRNYPESEVRVIDLRDKQTQKEILNLNHAWVQNKLKAQNQNDGKELAAIKRFIEASFENVFTVGVYYKNALIGYGIFSFHNNYVINHFMKADILYTGIYEFLMRECASLLNKKGYDFLNYLEDMGLPGLRKAKLTYRPIKFLRKFFVNKL